MGVSWLLCLLTVLLATASVQGLKCKECTAVGDKCAKEDDKVCTAPDDSGCNTMAEESTLEGTTAVKGFSKGCIAAYGSGLQGELTFTSVPGRYMRINVKQCNTELCNKDPLTAPKENTTLNGLQCPSCLALDAQTCIPITIPCKGNETLCIDLTGNFKKGAGPDVTNFAAQGCTTQSMETIKNNLPLGLGKFTITGVITTKAENVPAPPPQPSPQPCTQSTSKPTTATTSGANPAPGQVPFALFLPGLTGLLLVKLLS